MKRKPRQALIKHLRTTTVATVHRGSINSETKVKSFKAFEKIMEPEKYYKLVVST